MDTARFSAEEVAQFLQDHPGFFEDHAELFTRLKVPHPYQSQAISLAERQILLLRERGQKTERQLSALLSNARGSEKISRLLHQWNCRMLAEPRAELLPGLICSSLQSIFELPTVALYCWDPDQVPAEDGPASFAHTLAQPDCGPRREEDGLQSLQQDARSVAIVPLRQLHGASIVGLLVLGAEDEERFTADMATDFLAAVGELCSASLSRLQPDALAGTTTAASLQEQDGE